MNLELRHTWYRKGPSAPGTEVFFSVSVGQIVVSTCNIASRGGMAVDALVQHTGGAAIDPRWVHGVL